MLGRKGKGGGRGTGPYNLSSNDIINDGLLYSTGTDILMSRRTLNKRLDPESPLNGRFLGVRRSEINFLK